MGLLRSINRRLNLVWKIVLANVITTFLMVLATRILDSYQVAPIWPVGIAFFAILIGIDYVIVRVATAPLRILTRTAAQAVVDGAAVRATTSFPDPDVRQVAAVLNSLLFSLEKQRSDFTGRIFRAQEAERREIAQRLHDGPVQTLAVQQMQLGMMERRGLDPTTAKEVRDVADLGQDAIDALRAVIRDIRPRALDELGLVPAVSAFLDERLGTLGITHHLEVTESVPGRLPPTSEAVLFRAAQEAVHNVIRHAVASDVLIRLDLGREWSVLTVEDDGIGIGKAALAAPGLGILGMRERAALFGGRLEIARRKEGGTRVRLTIPSGGETNTAG